MWKNLLNQQKIAFINAIKSEETAKILEEFMKKDEIFIPRKLKEKITPQNTKEQKIIKANLNLMKLIVQTEILKDKTTHYKTKYEEIDQEIITEISELCPIETQQFLIELWEDNCKKEKEKSRKILDKKTTRLKSLSQKEKEKEEKNTNKRKIKSKKKS